MIFLAAQLNACTVHAEGDTQFQKGHKKEGKFTYPIYKTGKTTQIS